MGKLISVHFPSELFGSVFIICCPGDCSELGQLTQIS